MERSTSRPDDRPIFPYFKQRPSFADQIDWQIRLRQQVANSSFRLLAVTVALSALVRCAIADEPSPDDTLRVMTFNIRFGMADDGENSWPHRRDFLVGTIRAFDPDILGLQEATPLQIETLRGALLTHDYVGRSRERDNPNGEQCAILVRRERFEIRQSGTFWLSETPEEVGSKSWDAALPRISTWVDLIDHRAGDQTLRCYNAHFDHVGNQSRLESAKLLRARIDPFLDKPLVIIGDFNAPDDGDVHEALVGSANETRRLANAVRAIRPNHDDDEATYHGFKGSQPGKPVDWILFNTRLRCVDASINKVADAGRFPSDHFPIQATLSYDGDACIVK